MAMKALLVAKDQRRVIERFRSIVTSCDIPGFERERRTLKTYWKGDGRCPVAFLHHTGKVNSTPAISCRLVNGSQDRHMVPLLH
jgi:hypothetical protein